MLVHPVPGASNTFSHGKGSYHSTDPKTFDMAKTEACKGCCDDQTDHIETDLDLRISHRCDLGQFSWEKICGYDWHLTAVGDGDSNAKQNVACDKVKNTPAQCGRKNVDPQLMYIQQFSKNKSDHKAEQILCDESFSQDHQGEHQKSLEYVGPGPQADLGKYAGKCVRNAGNSGYSCAGIKHQNNAKAVDGNSKKKGKLPAQYRERF